jgi:hypothetical protein
MASAFEAQKIKATARLSDCTTVEPENFMEQPRLIGYRFAS